MSWFTNIFKKKLPNIEQVEAGDDPSTYGIKTDDIYQILNEDGTVKT